MGVPVLSCVSLALLDLIDQRRMDAGFADALPNGIRKGTVLE